MGRWQEGEARDNVILDYYQTLFTSVGSILHMKLVNEVGHKVTNEMNERLSTELIAKEITMAVKQMHLTKVSGPDGMAPIFFQNFWDIIGLDVTSTAHQTLNTGMF